MIETAAMSEPTAGAEPPVEPEAAPTSTSEAAVPPARRTNKLMADLSRAMQAAAETAKGETMTRFEVEAKTVIEEIHAHATDEAADLRRRADDDVAAIREWSKAEIARIREETEARISARKANLEGEMEQHASTVDARVERVNAVVAAFEEQMAAFFDRLNAEEDPTRIATMAETMPEPPSLADVAASVDAAQPVAPAPTPWPAAVEPEPEPDVPTASMDLFGAVIPEGADETPAPVEFDFAAAEAEAASLSGDLDVDVELTEPAPEELSAADVAARLDIEPASTADLATSRVVVSGLVSVANIANFKRSLARMPGVATIGVASGPDGDFVFTVGHSLGTGLSASVQSMPGFDIEITSETDDAITVAAQDRDATD
jgi:hypothetical protein